MNQITANAMLPVANEFRRRIITSFHNQINNPKFFISMEETAVYLNCSPKRTVHPKGERTVSIRVGGSSSTTFTLAVSVAMDGTKLPLFVIFKGKPGGSVERSPPSILPAGVIE